MSNDPQFDKLQTIPDLVLDVSEYNNSLFKPNKTNFTWTIGDGTNDLGFSFYVPRKWFNRMKWWIGTKICIPGTYAWDKRKKK